jgi:hypothetical protein
LNDDREERRLRRDPEKQKLQKVNFDDKIIHSYVNYGQRLKG